MTTGKSTASKRAPKVKTPKKSISEAILEANFISPHREDNPAAFGKCGCGSLCGATEFRRNSGRCDACAISRLGNGDADKGKRLLEERTRKFEEQEVLLAHYRSGKGGIFGRGMPAARLGSVAVGTGSEVHIIDVDTQKVYLYRLVGEQTRDGVKDVETGKILPRR